MQTHWKKLANYDFLGSYSLAEGQEVVLTIKEVKKELVTAPGGAKEDCIVAHFVETKVDGVEVKPMVLNKTNCKVIEKLYGSYIEDWVNKPVIVVSTTTRFARDIVPCLRIKAEKPEVKVYTCSVCGKVITKQIYDASLNKYGVAVCSKECLDKTQENKEEGENK